MRDITYKIMRRVWFIYIVRKIASPPLVKLYIALALLWQTRWFVSWGNVFENAAGVDTVGKMYTFSLSAIGGTELVVQLLGAATLLLVAWMFSGLRRNIMTRQPV